MDPSSLKVVELRKELASRGLSTTGKKDALVQRLKEALSLEKVEGKCAEGPGKEDQAVKDNPMAPTSPESNDTISNPVPSTKQANSPNENELTTDKRKVESIDEREEKVCASNDEQVSPSDPGERRKGGVKRKARSPSPCETMARSTTSGVVEGPEDQEESRENNVLSKKRRSFTGQGGFNRLFDSAMTSVHHPGNQAVIRQSAQRAQPTSTEEAGARQIPQFPQTQSTVLCTRNFVRPLRVPQVRELMMSFGEVEEFWMDPLKSRCYVRVSESGKEGTNREHGGGEEEGDGMLLTLTPMIGSTRRWMRRVEHGRDFGVFNSLQRRERGFLQHFCMHKTLRAFSMRKNEPLSRIKD